MTDDDHKGTSVSRRRLIEVGVLASGGALASSDGRAATPGRADPALDGAEVSPQVGTGASVDCGGTVTGRIGADDELLLDSYPADFYRFAGTDSLVTIAVRTEWDPETGSEPLVVLLDSTGEIVAWGTTEYATVDGTEYVYSQIAVFRPPGSGPYTVGALGYSPDASFDYRLSVDCLTLSPEERIECGETVSGALTTDDPTGFSGANRFYDAYAFPVPEGNAVRLDVTTPNPDDPGGPDDPSLGDSYLYLVDPDGEVVAVNDDWDGFDSLLSHYAEQEGEYTVVVSSYAPADEFEYELTATCRAPPEPTAIECGATVTGELTSDDPPALFDQSAVQDAYRFEAAAGEEVTVTVDGTEPYGYADPLLYLLDPERNVIAESGYGWTGEDALVSHTLPADGEYTLVVVGHLYDGSFPYELTLACDDDPFYCPVRCDDTIEYGEVVVEKLAAADDRGFRGPGYLHDAYCFDAAAGDVVTVSMVVADAGYEEPYLYLLGPNDAVVAQDRDGGGYGNAIIGGYEIPESGTYTVVATSASAEATVFDYTLALQRSDPAGSYYQVDFVEGEPIEVLGRDEDAYYGRQNRLIQYAHVSGDEVVERDAWLNSLDADTRRCIDAELIEMSDGTASVTFTVEEGCERTLSLAVYWLPGGEFAFGDRQPLVDAATDTFGPGEHTVTVPLPVEEGGTGNGNG